jgi:hypothetical protein
MKINDFQMALRAAVEDALARVLAIVGLTAVALIHSIQAPDAFSEAGYVGALFIVAVVGCVLLATTMTRTSDDRAWMAVGGLAGLILLGYILSRSVGLPGFTSDMGEWDSSRGLASMVAESTLVVLSGTVLLMRREATADAPSSAAQVAPGGAAPAGA